MFTLRPVFPLMNLLEYFMAFLLLSKFVESRQFLDLVRTKRAIPYQSHFVDLRNLRRVKNGEQMPINAVRPFGRALTEDGKKIDYVVAKWVPQDRIAVWGKAWEENGVLKAKFFHQNTVKTNDHPDVAKGYFIVTYNGTVDDNGFRFSWELVKDVDGGTVVYSSENRHVSAVYCDPITGNEYLGETIWDKRIMEYVRGDRDVADEINSHSGDYFDKNVYVLTKQRCNCQC